jgi:sec-independent protein translocase protein TatB
VFGIQGFELVVLGVLAMLLLGPEKLPKYAAEAARMLRTVRGMAANAQSEVRRELGPEFNDISLDDLNPRKFVTKQVLGDLEDYKDLGDLGLDDDERPVRRRGRSASPNRSAMGNGSSAGEPARRSGASAVGSDGGGAGAARPPAQRDGGRPAYDPDAT